MSIQPALVPFAELHCHTNFSFLDGASAADELVDRAVALGLSALAVTDHNGLYGVVRFSTTAREAGLHPVVGIELELARRGRRRTRIGSSSPGGGRSGEDGGGSTGRTA